jgi:hypothetical protein
MKKKNQQKRNGRLTQVRARKRNKKMQPKRNMTMTL